MALLRDQGVEVDFPEAQTCCGQPAFNSGFHDDGRRVARNLLEAMEGADVVVTPSGSCAAMVRNHFPALFRGTGEQSRAESLARRTHEITEFLVDVLGVEQAPGTFPARVTYHDSCHALRELGLRDQGRRLLAGIGGLELVEMARPEACCGFGGTFSVRLPDVAAAMADDKLGQAGETGAQVLVAGDVGCLMHLEARAARTGCPIRALHVATLLAEARGLRRPPP